MVKAVKEGFMSKYVPITGKTLKDLHKVELQILLDVTHFCDDNKINYFLSSGTLLGAVRHKGFIPWDDDIDISMPRKDFEKFIQLSSKLPDKYVFQVTNICPNYPNMVAKVRKIGTIMKEPAMSHLSIDHGIWIDIFPIDKVSNVKYLNIRARIIYLLTTVINYKLKVVKPVKATTKMTCYFLSLLGVRYLDKLRTFFMSLDEHSKGTYYTSFASNLGYIKLLFSSEILFPFSKVEFEGHEFNAPAQPDIWLKNAYGNYMELPRREERKNSHLVVELKI